jgi:hypothetical protein
VPKLKIKQPCRDCPYRRNSTPGWLGKGNPTQEELDHLCEHYVEGALSDYAQDADGNRTDIPCHLTIQFEDPDWEQNQYPDAPLCAGALIFAKNNFKSPREPQRREAVDAVEHDPNVFRYPFEFFEHHGGELKDPMQIHVRERVREREGGDDGNTD